MFVPSGFSEKEREGEERENVQSDRLGRVRRSPWQNVAGNIRESQFTSLLLTRGGIPGDVNFDYSQIQWQGLWPRHLPVLRSKTARKVCRYDRLSSALVLAEDICTPCTHEIARRDELDPLSLGNDIWRNVVCTFQCFFNVYPISLLDSVLTPTFFFFFYMDILRIFFSIDSRNLTFTDLFNRSKAGR